MSHRNVLDAFSRLLGVPDDERDVILNAPGYPPKPNFKLSFDVTRLRTLLNYTDRDDPIPRPTAATATSDPSPPPLGETESPSRLIVFSKPPKTTPQPEGESTSLQQTMLDLAGRAFASASVAFPAGSESNLTFWTNAMGWAPHLVYPAGIPPSAEEGQGKGTAYHAFLKDTNASRSVIPIMAPYGEGDFQERERPKDLLVLSLSHSLFVGPSLQAGLGVLRLPTPVLAPVASPEPRHFNVVSPPLVPRVPLLVTPAHVKQYLPSLQWRVTFWKEFDRVMIVHDGIGGLGPNGFLRRRIESMIEWAETYDEPHQDRRSPHLFIVTSTHTYVDDGSGSVPQSPHRTRTQVRGSPPTLSLFALAASVFALGALNFACKAAHGLEPELSTASSSGGSGAERSKKPPRKRAATLTPFLPSRHPIPAEFSPHMLHSVSRACLLASDTLDLPPSLDYLHAHILGWLYLLHPSESLSASTNAGFNGAVRGVAGGAVTCVEAAIWKDLGKCVNVARGMGLDVVDREDEDEDDDLVEGKPVRGNPDLGRDEMSFWEKEIRRRVWWQLVCFETCVLLVLMFDAC